MFTVRDELRRLIQLMVDAPEEVEIEEERSGDTTVFAVSLAEEDIGKVIGRYGRTVRALRAMVAARGERDGQKYEVEILD